MNAYYHVEEGVVRATARRCFELLLAARRYGQWWAQAHAEVLGVEGRLEAGSRLRFACASAPEIRATVEVVALRPWSRIDLAFVAGDLRGAAAWEVEDSADAVAEGAESSDDAPAHARLGAAGATRVAFVWRGVRAHGERARRWLEGGDALHALGAMIRDEALPGMRRLLERGDDPGGADLFTALHTQRAVRRFRSDPVPDAVLREILAAAVRAPSARNAQPWAFVAVRDPAVKQEIGRLYLAAWRQAQAYTQQSDADADIRELPGYAEMMQAVDSLARDLAEVPVLVLACLDTQRLGPLVDAAGAIRSPLAAYASIFPAVQNLMLAARGLGLGSTLTTLTQGAEADIRAVVAMPAHMHLAALIPLGYPRGPFRETRRRPLDEVACLDRWGTRLPKD